MPTLSANEARKAVSSPAGIRGQSTVAPNDVGQGQNVPFPNGCNSDYSTPTRFITCTHATDTWTSYDPKVNKVYGIQDVEYWQYWKMSYNSLTIEHGMQLAVRGYHDGTAFAAGANVSIDDPCEPSTTLGSQGAGCTATAASNGPDPVTFVKPNTFFDNVWTEHFNLGSLTEMTPGTVPGSALAAIIAPTVLPFPTTSVPEYLLEDNAWRCDNQLVGSIGAGCVAPDYTPTIAFNTASNQNLRPVALHMRDAQASLTGHPGQPGSGKPLHRLRDDSKTTANRNRACAGFVANPPVATSCDEYPFASTYESYNNVPVSIRAVPIAAQDAQGGALSASYMQQRILDNDAYYVQITIDDSTNQKVMVVGDSISQGLDGDFTWRYRLWQHFQSDGVNDAFVGPRTGTHDLYSGTTEGGGYRVGGWDTAHDALWGRAALDEQNTIQSITATYHPDVILVELGINDLVWYSTPTQLRDTMSSLITNARKANPNAKFVVGNVMDRVPLPDWPDLPGKISSYDQLLPGLVSSLTTSQSPVVMTDLHAALNPATDTHDGLHPNEIGEFKIAAAFSNTLASAYGIGQSFGAVPTSAPTLTRSTPTLTVTPNDGGALLSWTHSYGADGYWIYAENVSGGETTLAKLPIPIGADHWQAGSLADDQDVKYVVQSRRSDTDVSPLSNAVEVVVHPKTPMLTNATYATSCVGCNYVATSWSPITAADSYALSWVDETAAPNTLVSGTSTSASFNIPAVSDHKYIIAVAGVNQYGVGLNSGVPATYAGMGAPSGNQLTKASYVDGWTAHLEWTAVPGAAGNRIWTRNFVNGDPFTPLLYPVDGLTFNPGLMVDGAVNHEFEIQPINGSMLGPLSAPLRVT